MHTITLERENRFSTAGAKPARVLVLNDVKTVPKVDMARERPRARAGRGPPHFCRNRHAAPSTYPANSSNARNRRSCHRDPLPLRHPLSPAVAACAAHSRA